MDFDHTLYELVSKDTDLPDLIDLSYWTAGTENHQKDVLKKTNIMKYANRCFYRKTLY